MQIQEEPTLYRINKEADKTKGRMIRKANKLVNSRQNFTLTQQRAIILAISQIKATDDEFTTYRVKISEALGLEEGVSLKGAQYRQVREELSKLAKTSIDIKSDDQEWESINFISRVRKERGKDYVSVEFSVHAMPFLLNLKGNYTSYFVQNVYKFRKAHSIRLYELCKQYAKIGSRIIDFGLLRDILYLGDSEYYKQYGRFNREVLKPCVKEINETSDLNLSYSPIKEGRKVVRIHFKVQSGVGPTKVLQSRKTIKREASETSPVSGAIPQKVYERLVGKYTEERVQFYLELLTKRPDIKNISAYLIKALQESYYEEDFRISRKVQEERLERIRAKQIRDQRKGQREEISHAFDLHRKELLLRYEQRMEASDIEVFTFLFEESDNAQERKYVKEIRAGEASRLAKNFCVEWYIREYGDKADVRLLDVKHFSKAKYNFDW